MGFSRNLNSAARRNLVVAAIGNQRVSSFRSLQGA